MTALRKDEPHGAQAEVRAMRVLIIEDDTSLAEVVRRGLVA